MFPLGMLGALALAGLTAFTGYQYAKAKNAGSNNTTTTTKTSTSDSDSSTAKNVNTYNYYTNDSETGNTLFGTDKKQKRTLFGSNTGV